MISVVMQSLVIVFLVTVMFAGGTISFGTQRDLSQWDICGAVDINVGGQ